MQLVAMHKCKTALARQDMARTCRWAVCARLWSGGNLASDSPHISCSATLCLTTVQDAALRDHVHVPVNERTLQGIRAIGLLEVHGTVARRNIALARRHPNQRRLLTVRERANLQVGPRRGSSTGIWCSTTAI